MPLYAYSVTFSKRKKCVGFFIGLYIPCSCWAFMVEPHRHLGHWSCPLRPTVVMGSLERPCSLEVAHSLPAQWPHQTPDMGSHGPCCFSSLFLGLAFKLPKRLDLISWVGMIQSGSISRPKHLPGHQVSLQESTGVLGMTFAVDTAWWITGWPPSLVPANCMPVAASEIMTIKSALCFSECSGPTENHCYGKLGSDANSWAHWGFERRKVGCHDGTADAAAMWIRRTPL